MIKIEICYHISRKNNKQPQDKVEQFACFTILPYGKLTEFKSRLKNATIYILAVSTTLFQKSGEKMSDSWPEIRRKDRRLTDEESREVLRLGEYGILGTVTSKGNPYAVPLSYLYLNGRIYFHCATVGHKLESLKNNAQSCFTVVRNTLPVYDNSYSTYYESVMAFGPTSEVVDKEKKYEVLYGLAEK